MSFFDEELVDKYSYLVPEEICILNNVDPTNMRARGILAYNLLNYTKPIKEKCEDPFITFSNEGNEFSLFSEYAWDGNLSFSFDKRNWHTWKGEQITANKYLYLRGSNNTKLTNNKDDCSEYHGFKFTGTSCTGNIENLLDYETVSYKEHPRMNKRCFAGLFYGCTFLKYPPELPSMDLTEFCYTSMFQDCISLLCTPELPAIELREACYKYMFSNCISLHEPPKLPEAKLAWYCYDWMFMGCYSLSEEPELPVYKPL